MKPLYLTKSRFKLALECMTKLYYTGKKKEYCDKNQEDSFLQALADGGNQVGELAKFYFCEDPIGDEITVDTLNADEAIKRTNEMLSRPGKVVIAEAAFKFNNLFVRADVVVKDGDTLFLYEVKAKSYDPIETKFLVKTSDRVSNPWVSYVYDVAFQKYVAANSEIGRNFRVKAHLMLVDKSKTATIQGLNQLFKIIKDGTYSHVEVKAGVTKKDLGRMLLTPIDLDEICENIIHAWPVPTDYKDDISFVDFVNEASRIYTTDEKVYTSLGKKCKDCQFYKDEKDEAALKNGFMECWMHKTKLSEEALQEPLVLELWNGLSGSVSYAENLLGIDKYFMRDIEESDIAPTPKTGKAKEKEDMIVGLKNHERRMEQINRIKARDTSSYFDVEGMRAEMEKWNGHYPLHMIDFETSAVALPFHDGARPYEGIAFQFSHHIIDEHWNIEHKTQYLSFEQGFYPNFEFVRELKKALSNDNGKVFRYHNHENSYLGMIYQQLATYPGAPDDKDELMAFIKTITHSAKDVIPEWKGNRDMIDLYELVLRYYYPPAAKGSNSLKFILPALINDSEYLRNKYGNPGKYGKSLPVKSLNFDDHVWIQPDVKNNPYKTLPRVFDEFDPETIDALVKDFENIADGGAALTAYNYLQYSDLPLNQRESIKAALFRYCELDTMAMVMILEGWKAMVEK